MVINVNQDGQRREMTIGQFEQAQMAANKAEGTTLRRIPPSKQSTSAKSLRKGHEQLVTEETNQTDSGKTLRRTERMETNMEESKSKGKSLRKPEGGGETLISRGETSTQFGSTLRKADQIGKTLKTKLVEGGETDKSLRKNADDELNSNTQKDEAKSLRKSNFGESLRKTDLRNEGKTLRQKGETIEIPADAKSLRRETEGKSLRKIPETEVPTANTLRKAGSARGKTGMNK
jgi:hypothetical protein